MGQFEDTYSNMQRHGMKLPPMQVLIQIPNAKEKMKDALALCLQSQGRRPEWIPEYDQIAHWLTNNEGKGLLLFGACGRGKTFMARYVIPIIFLNELQKVVSSYDMNELNANIDQALKKKIIGLDDVGTEELSVRYGERRYAFPEVVDAAEKEGKLLIITTNLEANELKERYGYRIIDRLLATTKRIAFNGKSFRSDNLKTINI